jgi:hypothetical protein
LPVSYTLQGVKKEAAALKWPEHGPRDERLTDRRSNPMKRWLLRFGVAIATFTLGCLVYFLSGPVQIVYWKIFGALPYCDVARNAEQYHDRDLVIKARLIFDGSGIYVYEDCDPTEALAASVVLAGNHPLIGREYVEKLLVSGEQTQLKTAEAIIEGRFDGEATTGCWAPKFRIDAKKIELISPVTDYSPPVIEDEGLRLKH